MLKVTDVTPCERVYTFQDGNGVLFIVYMARCNGWNKRDSEGGTFWDARKLYPEPDNHVEVCSVSRAYLMRCKLLDKGL